MIPEQRKLYRILKLITLLKLPGGKTIPSLSEILEISERTVYRYIKLLDSVGFPVDCKPGSNLWFLVPSPGINNETTGFLLEEASLIRDLVVSGAHRHPLRDSILQKLYIQSELHPLAENLVNARINVLLEKLIKAIREEKQVILKNYHSAHSGEVKDYRVEPFDFTENYNTVLAYDTSDRLNKQFKLERIGEILPLDKKQKYKNEHEKHATDAFGCIGPQSVNITLKLNLRAFLLLREEFPRALPLISRKEEGNYYIFHGPVNGFEGAGRFVLGLIDDIEIVKPESFRKHILERISAYTKKSGNELNR